MAQSLRIKETDTVIIGSGPSALILSYILHGHVPYYNGGHTDRILDQKLKQSPNLLNASPEVYGHFRSSLKYSSTALPVNEFLDTLLRPYGDTQLDSKSCVEWRYDPQRVVPHLVLGNTTKAGGQWQGNPLNTNPEIGALSYADQLSLPGYSLAEHWKKTKHEELGEFVRPSRRDLAEYYAAYPAIVGIADTLRTEETASWVTRTHDGFFVASHNLHCKNIVLASGTFSINLPPPHFLEPLQELEDEGNTLLVIGSGFTAADIMISTPPTRKIIHLYNWDPEHRPSPLKACHRQAYPEYWFIYQQMKNAAIRFEGVGVAFRPTRPTPKSDLPSFMQRDWAATYEGLPNCRILSVADVHEGNLTSGKSHYNHHLHHEHSKLRSLFRRGHSTTEPPSEEHTLTAELSIGRSPLGEALTRKITSFKYAVGRRGSLSYLSPALYKEIFSHPHESSTPSSPSHPPDVHRQALLAVEHQEETPAGRGSEDHDFALDAAPVSSPYGSLISLHSLRGKIEAVDEEMETGAYDGVARRDARVSSGLEVAPSVFAIGSLTGDSLVRFAYGGCTAVAGAIMKRQHTGVASRTGGR